MPYQSNRFHTLYTNNNNHNNNNETNNINHHKNRIMWQLSFATTSKTVLGPLDASSLRSYVMETCQSWHEPVMALIHATPDESIWGTDLMDRDPRQVYQELVLQSPTNVRDGMTTRRQQHPSTPTPPRLAIIGDALHSMSCFKGQGANQALADGPLLAEWLQKSAIDAALKGWWRETLNRTAPIVDASRKAAQELHSIRNCKDDGHERNVSGDNNERTASSSTTKALHGFAGVKSHAIPKLMETLQQQNIGAHLGRYLDERIYEILEQNDWFEDENDSARTTATKVTSTKDDDEILKQRKEQQQQQALEFASNGNTQGLRQMSLSSEQCTSILMARDHEGKTCLHLATINQQISTAHWLLVELQCCRDELDIHGKTAFDYAMEKDHEKDLEPLIHAFKVVMEEEEEEKPAETK
jgi:hypothetical protein